MIPTSAPFDALMLISHKKSCFKNALPRPNKHKTCLFVYLLLPHQIVKEQKKSLR